MLRSISFTLREVISVYSSLFAREMKSSEEHLRNIRLYFIIFTLPVSDVLII